MLVRTGERRHHLIYTNHHILMDGWSNSQLLGEVLQRYRGETPSLSDGRYRDYIAWLQRQDAGRTEAFWKQRLSGWASRPCWFRRSPTGCGVPRAMPIAIGSWTSPRASAWQSSPVSRR
ncbi:condensation domain-containing protein [Pseudomonas aeruginosa]|nr:condensation domain-containing protein [Pseudomonas aeruginosa]